MTYLIRSYRSKAAHYFRRKVKEIFACSFGFGSFPFAKNLKVSLRNYLRKLPPPLKVALIKATKSLYYYDLEHNYYAVDIKKLTENAIGKFAKKEILEGEKIIDIILDHNLKSLPDDYRIILGDVVHHLFHLNIDVIYYEKMQQDLVKETEDLEASFLEIEQWLDLRYLCIRLGLFRTSTAFRNKAIEKAYNDSEGKGGVENIFDAFSATIDQGDFELAEYILEKYRSVANKEDYNEMLFYFFLCRKNSHNVLSEIKFNLDEIDKNFLDYISNKSIAIVGPAPCDDNEKGSEIDSFDVVIRSTYKGAQHLPNSTTFGSRIDVSYYSNEAAIMYLINQSESFSQNLKWIVFWNKKYEEASRVPSHKRRCFIKNRFYFCGVPNMVQNIVYDIIHFRPKKIKLFNLNFFLSKNTHYLGYNSTKEQALLLEKSGIPKNYKVWEGQSFSTKGFALHDLLSQLNFTRNLWLNKMVEVDNECSEVLSLKNQEYIDEMERIHIKSFLRGYK